MTKEFINVRGMRDLFDKDLKIKYFIENTARELATSYGYQEISTPIIEYTNEEIIQHLVKNIRLPRTSEMKSDPANSPSSSVIGEIYQPTLISTKQDVQNKIID